MARNHEQRGLLFVAVDGRRSVAVGIVVIIVGCCLRKAL